MTGFAEKSFNSKTLSAKISIRSLNHRFLDWSYKGNQIKEVENRLRAFCMEKIHRGRIEVYIDLNFLNPERWDLRINQKLLLKTLSSLEKVLSRSGRNLSISVEDVFGIPHVVELKRKNLTKEEARFLESGFEKTLDELVSMREKEGRKLKKEIQLHLQFIKKRVNRITKLANKQPVLIRNKMRERLLEIGEEFSVSEEKLVKEAAYMAQRFDLKEETARLNSHVEYAQEILSQKGEEPLGKKLDFIAQELYREANTINSKAQDIQIVRESLSIKGEVESIRQQVQNLE